MRLGGQIKKKRGMKMEKKGVKTKEFGNFLK